jgi:hypothetical protein
VVIKNTNGKHWEYRNAAGIGFFRKKYYSADDGIDGTLVFSSGIPAVPWNGNLSEFHSEPFRRGEKCSEFCNEEQK